MFYVAHHLIVPIFFIFVLINDAYKLCLEKKIMS